MAGRSPRTLVLTILCLTVAVAVPLTAMAMAQAAPAWLNCDAVAFDNGRTDVLPSIVIVTAPRIAVDSPGRAPRSSSRPGAAAAEQPGR